MFEGALRWRDPGAPAAGRGGLLAGCLAVRCPGLLTKRESAAYAECVLRARAAWTANFGGSQFTLGRAWYTHLEEDRADEYFAHAEASDATVQRAAPGLQERILRAAGGLLDAPVTRREGWCGPGVHVFPARGEVARVGGEVHFDTEGLDDEEIDARSPALTFVLMLQPAHTGGGLRVWDCLYAGDDFPEEPDDTVRSERIDYAAGELVVIDSYRLHQILPFGGAADRISATAHAVLRRRAWEMWF